ncbi:MAG: DinB family protein [Verrucomicrobiaceae bacterium]
MHEITEPQLAPPGAGLPKIELFVGRLMLRFSCRTGNRESFNARFQQEREKIRVLLESCDAKIAAKRVLIKRCRGLEDSSRNWSVWMTLDHLRIVNHAISRTISALTQGVVPPGAASTAAVKPSPAVTATVVADYEASCDDLTATVASASDLKSKVRFPHPWFGPLDAFAWHALSGAHMGIHRVQIEKILQGIATI